MKLTLLLVLLGVLSGSRAQYWSGYQGASPVAPSGSNTAGAVPDVNAPAAQPINPTLSGDLNELSTLITWKPIKNLIQRYMLNDIQFQNFVRTLNSLDAFVVFYRFRISPEVTQFLRYVQMELVASGDSFEMEVNLDIKLFNKSPYWSQMVYGWQGFVNEFMAYYPDDMIRTQISMKVAQGGSFAQFWQRVQALQVVYDRVISSPEALRVAAQLQSNGVDTNQLDQFVRSQFNWLNTTAGQSANPPAPAVSRYAPGGRNIHQSIPYAIDNVYY